MQKNLLAKASAMFAMITTASLAQATPLQVELRYKIDSAPPACASLAEQARAKWNEKWNALLVNPIESTVVETDKTPPPPSQNQFYAPVGSSTIFLFSPQLTGSFASLFINCESKEVYASLRGYGDVLSWYGPFKL